MFFLSCCLCQGGDFGIFGALVHLCAGASLFCIGCPSILVPLIYLVQVEQEGQDSSPPNRHSLQLRRNSRCNMS